MLNFALGHCFYEIIWHMKLVVVTYLVFCFQQTITTGGTPQCGPFGTPETVPVLAYSPSSHDGVPGFAVDIRIVPIPCTQDMGYKNAPVGENGTVAPPLTSASALWPMLGWGYGFSLRNRREKGR